MKNTHKKSHQASKKTWKIIRFITMTIWSAVPGWFARLSVRTGRSRIQFFWFLRLITYLLLFVFGNWMFQQNCEKRMFCYLYVFCREKKKKNVLKDFQIHHPVKSACCVYGKYDKKKKKEKKMQPDQKQNTQVWHESLIQSCSPHRRADLCIRQDVNA